MKKLVFVVALLGATVVMAQDAGISSVDGAVADAGVVLAPDAGFVTVVPSLDHPITSARQFYIAVKTGNGWLAAVFILFVLVGTLRLVGKKIHAMIPDDTKNWLLKGPEMVLKFFFDTKIGGWVLNWMSAIGGCLSAAIAAGMPVDMDAWKVALIASTGGTALIELKDDLLEWWNTKPLPPPAVTTPAPVQPPPAA